MKKYKGYILAVIFVIFCITVNVSYCSNAPIMPGVNDVDGDIKSLGTTIWNSAKLVLRIFAFAAIVFSGIMYMMSSADRRADIKTKLIILVTGAIIVFGSTYIIEFIRDIGNDILK